MLLKELQEGTRCWKGYKKKGMKTMFGKRVPNCVKNEGEEPQLIHNAMVEYVSNHFVGYEHNYDTMEEIEHSINELIKHVSLRDLNLHNKEVGGQMIRDYTSSPRDVVIPSSVVDEVKERLEISHIKEQSNYLKRPSSPYKKAVDMWLRSSEGQGKKFDDFRDLPVKTQNRFLNKFKVNETIEAAQDFNALMQGIEYDLANREKEIEENLRAWFGKGKKGGAGGGGWDRYNTKGERIGKCGDSKKGEGKPKCLSKSKAASLRAKGGKKAIGAAVSKKRRNDPNKNRKGKAKNVSNTVKKKK